MNVVVSAIVDPWVTTLSFVVALAMRIQGQILQILLRNQARSKSGAEQKLSAPRLHNSQVKERVVEHVD